MILDFWLNKEWLKETKISHNGSKKKQAKRVIKKKLRKKRVDSE
jgi:hypothetical protein